MGYMGKSGTLCLLLSAVEALGFRVLSQVEQGLLMDMYRIVRTNLANVLRKRSDLSPTSFARRLPVVKPSTQRILCM